MVGTRRGCGEDQEKEAARLQEPGQSSGRVSVDECDCGGN